MLFQSFSFLCGIRHNFTVKTMNPSAKRNSIISNNQFFVTVPLSVSTMLPRSHRITVNSLKVRKELGQIGCFQ